MRRLTHLLACLLLLPGLAGAEPTRAEQEAQILATHQGYAEAVLASDWNAAARFFDAAGLKQLRDMMEPVFVMNAGEGDGKTVGEMMTRRTPDELKDMDDAGFFGAFMDGIIAMNPGVAEAMAGSTYQGALLTSELQESDACDIQPNFRRMPGDNHPTLRYLSNVPVTRSEVTV